MNAPIWLRINDVNAANLAKIKQAGLTTVHVDTAQYNNKGILDYAISQAEIDNFVTLCHNAGLKAGAWTHYRWDGTKIDLTTEAKRAALAEAAKQCLNKGFDIFEDDLEPYVWGSSIINLNGSWGNYTDFLEKIGAAAKSVGKEAQAAINVSYVNPVETIFAGVTQLSRAEIMLYNGGTFNQTDFNAVIPRALGAAKIPILAGVIAPFNYQFDWLNAYMDRLAGVAIFEYNMMDSYDWSVLSTWLKTQGTTPTPEPQPTPTAIDVEITAATVKDSYTGKTTTAYPQNITVQCTIGAQCIITFTVKNRSNASGTAQSKLVNKANGTVLHTQSFSISAYGEATKTATFIMPSSSLNLSLEVTP